MTGQTAASLGVLVVDDHVLFRDGLVSLFQSTPDFHVVAQAGTVEEAVEKAFHHRPEIILMDFSLPDGTGLDATRIILEELPECSIIFLTVYETDENLLKAIQLGAKGYMLKNVSSSSLLVSLRSLAHGEMAMSRRLMSRALEEYSRSIPETHVRELAARLSARELEVLAELQTGASNADLSQRLYISENTVKHHIRSILEKLQVENRRQAGEIARRMKLKARSSDPR